MRKRSGGVRLLSFTLVFGIGCSSPETPDTTPTGVEASNGGGPGDGAGGSPVDPPPTPPNSSPPAATPPPNGTLMPPPIGTPPPPATGGGGSTPGTGGAPPAGGTPPTNGGGPSGGTPPVGGMDMGPGGTVGIAGMNAAGTSAGGGAGGATAPSEVVPTLSGQDYSIALGSATLVANGPTGRITQLVVGGTNRLTTSSVNPMNYGSSFWTAPQSIWSWPPPFDAVDETTPRTDYVHGIEGNAVVFTSPTTAQGDQSATITKRFRADAARDLLVLEFTIHNAGTAAFSAAPWQITRVVPQGFTFYPSGDGLTQSQIPVTTMDGVDWIDYGAAITDGSKNIGDGTEGWLAHVDDGLLFLKVFPEIAASEAAPGEGEIEIYVESTSAYVELEPQGPYASIAAGADSPSWQVLWLVRPVPAEVTVELGSPTLVEWVRSIVAEL